MSVRKQIGSQIQLHSRMYILGTSYNTLFIYFFLQKDYVAKKLRLSSVQRHLHTVGILILRRVREVIIENKISTKISTG